MELSTIFSSMAAVLTTVSFLPQAIKTIRTKDTKSISLFMYIIFNTGLILWFVYGIMEFNVPIILANGITFIFTFVILLMKIKYK